MEHLVGTDGYEDLAKALASSIAGDVIVVDSSYVASDEVVLVDRAVTIRSDGGQVTVPPLVIDAYGPVSLEGLRFSVADGLASPCTATAALFDADALAEGVALCVLGGEVVVSGTSFEGESGIGAVVVGGQAQFAGTSFSGWTRGAVWAVGSAIDVTDSSFLSGSAVSGAGVFAVGSSLLVSGTTFHGLHASRDGGALALFDTYTEIVDSVFDEVSAEGDGGAVWASGSGPFDVVVASTVFAGSGLTSARRGGAIAMEGGRLFASGVAFTDLAAGEGGAVFAERSVVDATRLLLCGNEAEHGGAVALVDASLALRNGRSIGNRALRGAALQATGSGVIDVSQSTFVDDAGDAVVDASGPAVLVRGSILASDSPMFRLANGSTGSGDHDLWWRGEVGVGDATGLALPSVTDVVGDPRFADYARDGDCDASLWLLPDSPAVDAGDPARLDSDGSLTDIGAYGGPDAVLPDLDRDGSTWGLDCDDAESGVYPGAPDVPLDGIDQDCDGEDSCDGDGDGVCAPLDCDDEASGVYPGAPERPYDGVDQDCSGADACDLDGDGTLDGRCGGDDCDDDDPDHLGDCLNEGRFGGGCSTLEAPRTFVVALLAGLLLRRRACRVGRP